MLRALHHCRWQGLRAVADNVLDRHPPDPLLFDPPQNTTAGEARNGGQNATADGAGDGLPVPGYASFVMDHLSRIPKLHATLHQPRAVFYLGAQAYRVPIGACDSMFCGQIGASGGPRC